MKQETADTISSTEFLFMNFYYLTGIFSHLSTSVVDVFLHPSQGSCQGAGQVKTLVGRWCANAASVPGCQSPWKRSAQACRLAAAETLERSERKSSGLSHRLVWGEYLKRMHRSSFSPAGRVAPWQMRFWPLLYSAGLASAPSAPPPQPPPDLHKHTLDLWTRKWVGVKCVVFNFTRATQCVLSTGG